MEWKEEWNGRWFVNLFKCPLGFHTTSFPLSLLILSIENIVNLMIFGAKSFDLFRHLTLQTREKIYLINDSKIDELKKKFAAVHPFFFFL